jgi:hypothetical protein
MVMPLVLASASVPLPTESATVRSVVLAPESPTVMGSPSLLEKTSGVELSVACVPGALRVGPKAMLTSASAWPVPVDRVVGSSQCHQLRQFPEPALSYRFC